MIVRGVDQLALRATTTGDSVHREAGLARVERDAAVKVGEES